MVIVRIYKILSAPKLDLHFEITQGLLTVYAAWAFKLRVYIAMSLSQSHAQHGNCLPPSTSIIQGTTPTGSTRTGAGRVTSGKSKKSELSGCYQTWCSKL